MEPARGHNHQPHFNDQHCRRWLGNRRQSRRAAGHKLISPDRVVGGIDDAVAVAVGG
jgi:hypothetical protein